MPAPDSIVQLVGQFTRNRDAYRSGRYNEAQLRQEFLNPFFEALGWDMFNRSGYAPQNREVIHEDSIDVEGGSRAPDYCFRLGQTRKFFVEAKKPAVDIQYDIHPAYQLRRYAWNAHLPLSILTDFEEFAVYDCRNKPDPTDSAATARILFIKYTQFVEKWDEIAAIFSRDAVWKGSFDQYAADNAAKKGTTEVDDAFLNDIEEWRTLLARNIALRNPQVATERQLNYAVQMTIDRIIFLRICEDRGIEPDGQLRDLGKTPGIYQNLVALFQRADLKYNSGLFHFKAEKGSSNSEDTFTPTLVIDDRVLKEIIKSLYYPCPYIFKEIPVEILGQVYEQFLGKVIRLTPGRRVDVQEKPEVRKAGGVYYTPKYIVDYIVRHTVGQLLEGKTPDSAAGLKILDPACGSGSFLLGAFQYLLDWHLAWYTGHDPEKWARGRAPALVAAEGGAWQLTTAEKKRILVNNLYGVDIDAQAVEVTKLSLLLKVLEEETGQMSLGLERALPDLGRNIQCGNSLIGWDYFAGQLVVDEAERERVNPFDWQRAFPQVFHPSFLSEAYPMGQGGGREVGRGGFDAVIGNPPYGAILYREQVEYFQGQYKYHNSFIDMYLLFLERYHILLKNNGLLGVIISNTWLQSITLRNIRTHLTNAYSWQRLLHLPIKVFNAVVDTMVMVINKNSNGIKSEKSVTVDCLRNGKVETLHLLNTEYIPLNGDPINFVANPLKQILAKRIINSSQNLGDLFDVFNGIKPFEIGKGQPPQSEKIVKGQIYVKEGERPDETWSPLLRGSLIGRFENKWANNYWVQYGIWLAAPRDPKIFEAPFKIMVRQTGDSIIATLVEAGFIARNNIHIILQKNQTHSLKFLLGLMNSRLMDFIYSFINPEKGEALAEVKKKHVEQLPIRAINFDDPADVKRHDQMVALVERMLELHRRQPLTPLEQDHLAREIAATDAQIDRLVYELYGLTEEEIQIVEGKG